MYLNNNVCDLYDGITNKVLVDGIHYRRNLKTDELATLKFLIGAWYFQPWLVPTDLIFFLYNYIIVCLNEL